MRRVKECVRVEGELIRGGVVRDARVVVRLHGIIRLSVVLEELIRILILIECCAVDLIECVAAADVAVIVRVVREMRVA